MDLKGLARRRVFHDKDGKAFLGRREKKKQRDFALEFYQEILKIVNVYRAGPTEEA